MPLKLDATLLPRARWLAALRFHHDRVAAHADAFVSRRSRGEKHPVHDFLFTYYSFAPARLKQWLPSPGMVIEDVRDCDFDAFPWLRAWLRPAGDGQFALDDSKLTARARELAAFVARLCEGILTRPQRFRCHGLHEWAMVYRQPEEQIRHQGWRLRLPPAEIAALVESQSLCCTHYDAFRFFTPDARPLNALAPDLESREQNEQAACLHANMDIYKWAHKLWPWCGSDLVADAFLLALECREIDMRASPYDLADLGCEPIRIETAAGREDYEREQRALAERARPVRLRLLGSAEQIIRCGKTAD